MKYIPYVNIKMGTASISRFSCGNTLPLTQRPFGMAPFCLQSDASGNHWFFHPEHPYTEGVRLTHQPSPWLGDFGPFLMMPQNDVIADNGPRAWSGYRPSEAVMRPDYLKVTMLRSNCTFELTPTERGAAIRLSFHDERPSVLSLLPVKGNYTYRYDAATQTVIGTSDYACSGVAVDFKTYFVLRFVGDVVDHNNVRIVGEDDKTCIHVALKSRNVEARIGTSYISEEMAIAAMERECGDLPFDTLRGLAENDWEEKLHRIEVTTKTEEQMRTFYSCLYRAFLFPQKAYELDENGKPVHYVPCTGKVREGVRYTNNGFWDTSRTVYSLFTLIARDEFADMLEGFVGDYEESGWLPRWLGIGEIGCMPSTLIDSVIACAAVNGIGKREVLEKALEGMLHHANNESTDRRYGRNGAASYLKYGYVPRNEQRESVNLTLDAAYGDWCIATVAKVLGRDELVEPYMARAKNYKNIFDATTGFMRGRDTEGKMAEFFDPCTWGGEYTEGSAWQNSFFVPHDIEGLAELYGGREQLIAKLDELFATPPKYRVFGYNNEIHEMTEMASVDFGQCAISNQPSFHLPFMYAALGEQAKTDFWVTKLCTEAFSYKDDGFPGDEDNGTAASWYVLSSLGMYPLCPGHKEMIRCQKQVETATILGKEI
ncbi:MAG: GH92 family glycosyl hydrolase [Clostridia bacterium]|nr:GH92 family glycosyl hydrolase [Clostridia bacterium]